MQLTHPRERVANLSLDYGVHAYAGGMAVMSAVARPGGIGRHRGGLLRGGVGIGGGRGPLSTMANMNESRMAEVRS